MGMMFCWNDGQKQHCQPLKCLQSFLILLFILEHYVHILKQKKNKFKLPFWLIVTRSQELNASWWPNSLSLIDRDYQSISALVRSISCLTELSILVTVSTAS